MKLIKPLSIATLFLTLIVALVGLSLLPVQANPAPQSDDNLPTPTGFPVDEPVYELSVVGGQSETLTFAGAEGENASIGETTAISNYPRGMTFRTKIDVAEGREVSSVTFFIRYLHGSGERVQATYDSDADEWVAIAWDGGDGQPAWTHFNFFWRVHDSNGDSFETEPATTIYSDPTREWYRVETEYVIFYWFGTDEVDPETVARNTAIAVAATEPRRIEGFGGPLGYKPVGVGYPTYETFGEMQGSGQANSNAAGYTSNELGMTVQTFSIPTDSWFERQKNCIYLTPASERTEASRINGLVNGVIPHEIAHLYQFQYGGAVGPTWWSEGQADYFSYAAGLYDNRLRHLATLQTIPSLNGNDIGSNNFEADGCYALAYDVGVSFINWLLSNYGGIETHHEIVQLYHRGGYTLIPALEEATGVSFFDLENQWRAYLGFQLLTLADVDPASALQDPIDSPYQVGDTVTLPANPRPQPLYQNPGPRQLSNAGCFGGSTLEILRVGSLDGINYYEVNCSGLKGWMTIEQLQ